MLGGGGGEANVLVSTQLALVDVREPGNGGRKNAKKSDCRDNRVIVAMYVSLLMESERLWRTNRNSIIFNIIDL